MRYDANVATSSDSKTAVFPTSSGLFVRLKRTSPLRSRSRSSRPSGDRYFSRGRPVPHRRIGALEIDPLQRRVAVAGRPVRLSRMEFELLSQLAVDPTRVYTKKQLLREVWGFKALGNTRTVDAHACRLRKKLSIGERRYLGSVRGVGYRLFAEGAH
jgi:DNA-binding response OmpR family regulator